MAEKQGAAAKQERKQKRGGGRQISASQVSTAVFGGCTKVRIAEHW